MDKFAKLVGRQYHLFDYVGAPDAERVVVLMGSGRETAHETVEPLNARGEKVGLLKVRLYRPFSVEHFIQALPPTVKVIAVLDRTKEPGAAGEPLYTGRDDRHHGRPSRRLPIRRSPSHRRPLRPLVEGVHPGHGQGRVRRAGRRPAQEPLHRRHRRRRDAHEPRVRPDFSTEAPDVVRAMFYGLGADGTVGANKNSIKIIGERQTSTPRATSSTTRRSRARITTSHLRFGPRADPPPT
jgi:pyruvate-ferredoxin/flavodoxin oxidoreductase